MTNPQRTGAVRLTRRDFVRTRRGRGERRRARNLPQASKGTEVGSDLVPTGTSDFGGNPLARPGYRMSQHITRMKAAPPELISEVPSRGASLETVAIPRTASQCVLEPIAQGPARRDDRADLTRPISRG